MRFRKGVSGEIEYKVVNEEGQITFGGYEITNTPIKLDGLVKSTELSIPDPLENVSLQFSIDADDTGDSVDGPYITSNVQKLFTYSDYELSNGVWNLKSNEFLHVYYNFSDSFVDSIILGGLAYDLPEGHTPNDIMSNPELLNDGVTHRVLNIPKSINEETLEIISWLSLSECTVYVVYERYLISDGDDNGTYVDKKIMSFEGPDNEIKVYDGNYYIRILSAFIKTNQL